jgi:hypothetical protein
MLNGTYYLNNSGTRCIHLINGKKPTHTFDTVSGKQVTRTVQIQEQWGNFARFLISYKGRRRWVFPDSLLED